MLKFKEKFRVLLALTILALVVTGCSDSDDDSPGGDTTEDTANGGDTVPDENPGSTDADTLEVNLDNFIADALLSSEIVDCTLSDGTSTQCYELVTVGAEKTSDMIGPFCPPTTTSTAEEGGVWLDGEEIYEADGDFFLNLPNLYGQTYPPQENWILYDENGDINITDTQEGCEAAARPDVDPEFQSFCVECALEYVDDLTLTFTIPVTPEAADTAGTLSGTAGISLNGFQIAAQAPVEDILSNFTIAAFDDCGGHINPNDGYHYHSATGGDGCNSSGTEADGHPSLIGYAMDGYGIYGTLADGEAELDLLDDCNGVEDATYGYHYHASSAETNSHIGCFSGKTVDSGEGGPGGPGGPPDGEPPE